MTRLSKQQIEVLIEWHLARESGAEAPATTKRGRGRPKTARSRNLDLLSLYLCRDAGTGPKLPVLRKACRELLDDQDKLSKKPRSGAAKRQLAEQMARQLDAKLRRHHARSWLAEAIMNLAQTCPADSSHDKSKGYFS